MGNRETTNSKEMEISIQHHTLNRARMKILNQQKVLKISPALDRKEYDRWRQILGSYEPHPSLFLPLEHTFFQTGLCGSAGTAEVLFPYFPHLLHDEIFNRLNKNGEFNEQQLWYLLFTLLMGKKVAKELGQMLGDIRPKNIMFNEKGRIKVPTQHSWPSELNVYQKMMANEVTYLAPEDISAINDGSIESKSVTEPGEMFSIGLTLLSAANLQDYEVLYSSEKGTFDLPYFEDGLSQLILNVRYSEVLRSTIVNLCSYDAGQRFGLSELFQILQPHSLNINTKNGFTIYNAPLKLHKEVQFLRQVIAQKTAQYPSSLPDRTSRAIYSDLEPSVMEKLVPSHLNENTSSAWDGYD